jgi:acylpyruvate hydrolase
VTPDEAGGPSHEIVCEVDGELMQKADTSDLVFGPAALVSYISAIITLEPGDIIATGTPGGVGAARNPVRFLADGETVVTRIGDIGECRNVCRKESAAP